MANKVKKQSQPLLPPVRIHLDDERIPKMLGMLLLFVAFYLTIAFVSYLFTWETDQDKVLRFSWSLLLQADLDMANWLGRLGAIVSNMFIYWGFGLPSFVLIYLSAVFGWALMQNRPTGVYRTLLRRSLLIMLSLSIFLAFVFSNSGFPWGGSFGSGVSQWLTSFVGTIGMVVLIIFAVVALITWAFNPNYQELTASQVKGSASDYLSNIFNRKYQSSARKKVVLEKRFKTTLPDLDEDYDAADGLEDVENEFPVANQANNKPSDGFAQEGQIGFDISSKNTPPRQKTPTAADGIAFEIEETVQPQMSNEESDPEAIGAIDINYRPMPVNDADESIDLAAELVNAQGLYDPTLELPSYEHPVLALLEDHSHQKVEIDRADLEAQKEQIVATLLNYKIEIIKTRATVGPTVTLFEIVPAPGVRISKIKSLEDDIALSLAALGIRIIAPIPGRGTIGIEVPNKNKQMVSLREVLLSDRFKRSNMELPIALGKTISNEVFVADLAKMPHLLIAGATGQGKSVGINTIIMSLLYKQHPAHVKLILIDPKKVELFPYSSLESHFLGFLPDQTEPIVTDTTKVIHTLNSLTIEMDERYNLLKKASARNIKEYNEKFVQRQLNPKKGHRYLPFIVLIIDEFADLIMTAGKEIELPIGRLAQLARAIGIHLIIATQRPSVNIITGVIKANFPARLAFKVSSKVDSRTILDTGGADQLIGRGDMLLSLGGDMVRLQCAYVDTPEVERVIKFISDQQGYAVPFFLPEFHGEDGPGSSKETFKVADLDEHFEDAARMIVQNQTGSTSMIQRRMKLGYNRAGRIMDQMEAFGIVGASEGSKPREVLIFDEKELERFLESIKNRK